MSTSWYRSVATLLLQKTLDFMIKKEVAIEPPMDLFIIKLITLCRLTWRVSNKVVILSFKRRRSGGVTVRIQICHVNGWGFASQLGALRFHNNSDCLHVSIRGTSFSLTLFKGNGYRYACVSWNLKTYSYTTCDVTVMHDESAVGLGETNQT